MSRNKTCLSVLAAVCVFAGAMPAYAADRVLAQTGFDTGLEGWTSNKTDEISWSAGGGHPGGRVVFTDASNSGTFLIAPSAFLAGSVNYRKLDGKAYFSFEHEIIQNEGTSVVNYEMDISGPGGTAVFKGGLPSAPLNRWQQVIVPLSEGNWTVTSGTWRALLADVESVQIRIELINGSPDKEAMDNIKLVSHPKGFGPTFCLRSCFSSQ